jgi:uncharacterized protein
VRDFFRLLFETQEAISFEPREFHFSDDLVFVLGHYEFAIKKIGRRAAADWLHVFKVENGKLTAFTEFTDTAQVVLAWR